MIFANVSNNSSMIIVLILSLLPPVIFLLIFVPYLIIRGKYRSFINEHSVALKQLKEINDKYDFKIIRDFDMEHSYDNQNYYENISCKDYLIYQLVYIQNDVKLAIKDTAYNKNLYQQYSNEIKETCILDKYDTTDILRNRNRLIRYEEDMFEKAMLKPTISFIISVLIRLTNINGSYKGSKKAVFSAGEIKELITKINQKRGNFYLDNDIWQAIVRVERGKVTNKMRFAIYNRDGYRCQICGKRGRDDLEIDHIIPIAKGGKTTYDNLQTLCRKCNKKKGANIW